MSSTQGEIPVPFILYHWSFTGESVSLSVASWTSSTHSSTSPTLKTPTHSTKVATSSKSLHRKSWRSFLSTSTRTGCTQIHENHYLRDWEFARSWKVRWVTRLEKWELFNAEEDILVTYMTWRRMCRNWRSCSQIGESMLLGRRRWGGAVVGRLWLCQWMSLRMLKRFSIRRKQGVPLGYVTRMALIWPIDMLQSFCMRTYCFGALIQFLGRMKEFWFLTTHWPVMKQRDRWQLFAEIAARHKITSSISLPFKTPSAQLIF